MVGQGQGESETGHLPLPAGTLCLARPGRCQRHPALGLCRTDGRGPRRQEPWAGSWLCHLQQGAQRVSPHPLASVSPSVKWGFMVSWIPLSQKCPPGFEAWVMGARVPLGSGWAVGWPQEELANSESSSRGSGPRQCIHLPHDLGTPCVLGGPGPRSKGHTFGNADSAIWRCDGKGVREGGTV